MDAIPSQPAYKPKHDTLPACCHGYTSWRRLSQAGRLARLHGWLGRHGVRDLSSSAPARTKRRCTTRSSVAGLADLLHRICHRSVARTVTVTRLPATTVYRHVAVLPALCSRASRPQKIGPATVVSRQCQDVLIEPGCQVHTTADVYLCPAFRHHALMGKLGNDVTDLPTEKDSGRAAAAP